MADSPAKILTGKTENFSDSQDFTMTNLSTFHCFLQKTEMLECVGHHTIFYSPACWLYDLYERHRPNMQNEGLAKFSTHQVKSEHEIVQIAF
jgi:hypothetical protein